MPAAPDHRYSAFWTHDVDWGDKPKPAAQSKIATLPPEADTRPDVAPARIAPRQRLRPRRGARRARIVSLVVAVGLIASAATLWLLRRADIAW